MEPIKVLLVDDHEIVRNGIKMLLEHDKNIEVIGEASNGLEALDQIKMLHPDILILDIRMPVMNGIELAQMLPEQAPGLKTLILSMHDDAEYVTKTVESGAFGYVLKDTSKDEFIKAIKTIYEGNKYFCGDISNVLVNQYLNVIEKSDTQAPVETSNEYHLTKREKQILGLLYQGQNNKEIADQLGKSIRTIETHRFNIMKKIGVTSVTDLFRRVEQEPQLKQVITSA